MPPLLQGNEAAGARWLMARVQRAVTTKATPEFADCLTNEVAGMFGMLAVMPLSVGMGALEGLTDGLKEEKAAALTR